MHIVDVIALDKYKKTQLEHEYAAFIPLLPSRKTKAIEEQIQDLTLTVEQQKMTINTLNEEKCDLLNKVSGLNISLYYKNCTIQDKQHEIQELNAQVNELQLNLNQNNAHFNRQMQIQKDKFIECGRQHDDKYKKHYQQLHIKYKQAIADIASMQKQLKQKQEHIQYISLQNTKQHQNASYISQTSTQSYSSDFKQQLEERDRDYDSLKAELSNLEDKAENKYNQLKKSAKEKMSTLKNECQIVISKKNDVIINLQKQLKHKNCERPYGNNEHEYKFKYINLKRDCEEYKISTRNEILAFEQEMFGKNNTINNLLKQIDAYKLKQNTNTLSQLKFTNDKAGLFQGHTNDLQIAETD
eukprot:97138_1